jgi:23S rRNA pseudouridine1911/1915/1917 synthase
VVKPAGWLTVPSPRAEADTLIQRVAAHLGRGRPAPLHAVQRLDRGVSGVLVLARTAAARDGLRAQLERHEPEREYLALVAGRLAADRGTFESRLATARSLTRYSTREGGEDAVTHWRVERRLEDATLVSVRLETGRRNQIRVHFAEAGHPVLGDPRYGPERARHRGWTERRLALHAATLAFTHPITLRRLRFEAPLPAAMRTFVEGG